MSCCFLANHSIKFYVFYQVHGRPMLMSLKSPNHLRYIKSKQLKKKLRISNVWYHKISIHLYLLHGKSIEFLRVRGVCKPNILKESMLLNWNFQRGEWVQTRQPSMWEVWKILFFLDNTMSKASFVFISEERCIWQKFKLGHEIRWNDIVLELGDKRSKPAKRLGWEWKLLFTLAPVSSLAHSVPRRNVQHFMSIGQRKYLSPW